MRPIELQDGTLFVAGKEIARVSNLKEMLRRVVLYTLLLGGSVFMLFPLFWTFSTSLKTHEEANAPILQWLPATPQLDAYVDILGDLDWLLYFSNSAFVTALAVSGTVISVAAVAYAFSRIEWPGRNIVFFLVLSTLMLPMQTTLVPQYVFFNKIDWIGTFNPITIPGFFAGSAMYIFLLRQFMMTLPRELGEAAVVDGAGHLQIWWRIILPLCKPALATITVFLFVGSWNSLQAPLIYLQRREMHTLPIAIANLRNPQVMEQPWPMIMAVSALTMIPLVITFLTTQRYMLESVVLTGTKS
jgi:multiple sugar transport system permease protein